MNEGGDEAPIAITVVVNGTTRQLTASPRLTVADLLREKLGLTGTHLGCEHGVCGACTILIDGESTRSCILYAGQVDGASILTVEGLAAADGTLHPVQEAFRQTFALQCGFCTPGFLMTIVELLGEVADPTDDEIREALSGNLCRCTGYDSIVAAVHDAARSVSR